MKSQKTLFSSLSKISTSKYISHIAFVCFMLFTAAAVLVSLHRFWQFESFYFDFGIFDTAIWRVSRFQAPIIEHFLLGGKWIFADHFSPSIFLLSPLYWFTSRSEMLLIVQAVSVGLSGLVLYFTGKKVLKENLPALSIMICYYLFLGLQNAIITDFHEITVMALPLMLTFWAIVNKKVKLYFFFLLLTLGFKEVMFLLGIGIGVTIFILKKEWRKIALATIVISMLWGVVTIKFIIPAFSQGVYIYNPEFPPGFWDKMTSLVNHPLKRNTLFYSLLSFGFLPILSPEFWFVILQDYIVRFLPKSCCTRWVLGFHYNITPAVLMGLASVYAIARIQRIKLFKKYIPVLSLLLILNAIFLFRFVLHGPLLMAINPALYAHSKDFSFLNDLIKKVPKNATVMTHNNLATRFTHQQVWLLRLNYMHYNPDYIVIDNREGQSPNNFFVTGDIEPILHELQQDKSYEIMYKTKDQFIFKRVEQ